MKISGPTVLTPVNNVSKSFLYNYNMHNAVKSLYIYTLCVYYNVGNI